ncbi:MAG: 50S ribosomal protein L30 [Candidatus Jidaibacter sp.]|nr:50S ribosomal protein L30 [Candidatus Jidaibacter sp.]
MTIKQIASGAGRLKNQIQTLKGLGLNKLNKVAVLEDTSSIRGMVRTVAHLIEVVKN